MTQAKKQAIYREQLEKFQQILQEETALLKEWFENKKFAEDALEAGSEIEFMLLDQQFMPAYQNVQLIQAVNDSRLVPEIGAAQLEINSGHFTLTKDCFSLLHQNILDFWQRINEVAVLQGWYPMLIGVHPNLLRQELDTSNAITNKLRYTTMRDYTSLYPYSSIINLHCREGSIPISSNSIWSTCGTMSALQLHLKVGLSASVKYYNTAQMLAGPMLLLTNNSPFLYGKHLWSDSRIKTLEQLLEIYHPLQNKFYQCYFFDNKYLKHSFLDLFEENLNFPTTHPHITAHAKKEQLLHIHLQNSLIHRWNRPIVDFNSDNTPHLRIEHRGPSVGPTVVDMVANAAFFYGIVHFFASQPSPIEQLLSCDLAKRNFYEAARAGFAGRFIWINQCQMGAQALMLELIPLARQGLQQLSITPHDIDYYLDIITKRVKKRQNGSSWQEAYIDKYGPDFNQMLAQYWQNQNIELPVGQWEL